MALLSELFVIVYAALCIARTSILNLCLVSTCRTREASRANLNCAETRYGLGLPIALRPKASLITYTRTNFAGRPIYQIGISFFKIALLISYLRLLEGTAHKTYRKIVWTTIAIVLLAHIACTTSLVFACTPVSLVAEGNRLAQLLTSRQKDFQIMESVDRGNLSSPWSLVHCLRHCHNYLGHRCRLNPCACLGEAQHSNGEETRPNWHIRARSIHYGVFHHAVYADRPHSERGW